MGTGEEFESITIGISHLLPNNVNVVFISLPVKPNQVMLNSL